MHCPKCGSDDIQFISNTQSKHRSALSWLFWILIAFCTFGIGLLFLYFMGITNSKTVPKLEQCVKIVVINGMCRISKWW
ncbi:MAG: hypothetical protein SPK63_03465 [Eubacteriales bacterium]|nr:hypothetical protein [Eubacteriales bacterium]